MLGVKLQAPVHFRDLPMIIRRRCPGGTRQEHAVQQTSRCLVSVQNTRAHIPSVSIRHRLHKRRRLGFNSYLLTLCPGFREDFYTARLSLLLFFLGSCFEDDEPPCVENIEYSSHRENYSTNELDEEIDANTSSADEEEDGSRTTRHRKSALFPHACRQDSLETLSLKRSNSIDINNTYLSQTKNLSGFRRIFTPQDIYTSFNASALYPGIV